MSLQNAIYGDLFRNLISALDDFAIFHYGNYDIRGLIRLCHRYGDDQKFKDLLVSRGCNVLSAIYGHVYFPCYGNDLKSVASCLGFKWHDPNSTGVKSIAQRLAWERSRCTESKDWLIRYNRDDCRALSLVTDAIYDLRQNDQINGDLMRRSVIHTDSMKDPKTRELVNKRPFFSELEIINRCYYFDYQRDRLYVRTDTALKKRVRRAAAKRRSRFAGTLCR